MKKVLHYKLPRMSHQKEGEREAFRQYVECRRLGTNFGFGYLFPTGTGKSATAINLLRRIHLYEGRLPRTLVVCPPVVIGNWKEEFLKFSDIHLKNLITFVMPGRECVERLKQVGWDHEGSPHPQVLIVNYEKLVTSDELHELIRAWRPELVILDEIHDGGRT